VHAANRSAYQGTTRGSIIVQARGPTFQKKPGSSRSFVGMSRTTPFFAGWRADTAVAGGFSEEFKDLLDAYSSEMYAWRSHRMRVAVGFQPTEFGRAQRSIRRIATTDASRSSLCDGECARRGVAVRGLKRMSNC